MSGSSPSISSAVLGRMDAGDEAIMTRQDGEWASITFNGTNGWVHTDYITQLRNRVDKQHHIATDSYQLNQFTVSVDALNVRKNADLSSKRIGLINQGESYAIKEIDGNWVRFH